MDAAPPQYAVPYDFDMTGIASLPHSVPDARFNLRSVRQRLYRGRCANNDFIPGSIAAFQERREAIFGLIDDLPEATRQTRNALRQFINGFYAVIDDPGRVERQLVNRCI